MLDTMDGYDYQYIGTHSERPPGSFGFTSYLFTSAEPCDVEITINGHYATISALLHPLQFAGERFAEAAWRTVAVTITGDHLFFANRVDASLRTNDWFTVDTLVESIGIYDHSPCYEAFEWKGIAPRSVYCQSQPEMAYDTC